MDRRTAVTESDDNIEFPPHVELATGSIARLQAEHRQQATRSERVVERMVDAVGRPRVVWLFTAFVAAWVVLNLLAKPLGYHQFDEPPFFWLGNLGTLCSLYMVILILATQRREQVLAKHHEQLTLELTMLSEQKTAKIIQLLEELRRDSPHLANRADPEAEIMASPVNPLAVLDAIRDLQAKDSVDQRSVEAKS
jgi:uncharacterized membrane protein